MKKIGVITLNSDNNYGNRLQNLALLSVLNKLGFESQTVIFKKKPRPSSLSAKLKRVLKQFKGQSLIDNVHMISRKIQRRIHKKKTASLEQEKVLRSKAFCSNYIKSFIVDYEDLEKGYPTLNDFDYFVSGSDQVWNPHLLNKGTGDLTPFEINFLSFAPHSKRTAYSASFGVSDIPEQFIEKYKAYLKGMHSISVREDEGAQIIKKLINKEVPVLVDPTLLLNQNEWKEISCAPSMDLSQHYILTYFLGGISESNDKMIKDYAKKHNFKIHRLIDPSDKSLYTLNPGEFLYIIDHCDMMLTDSFHGCVFSIQFEKPFIVFERRNAQHSMESRINTLLSKFDLENRKWLSTSQMSDYEKIDFTGAKKNLELEKKKAHDYLVNSLKTNS